jgi:CelD/BcsL family acetyltransferase involved in cellulose biosynthesis
MSSHQLRLQSFVAHQALPLGWEVYVHTQFSEVEEGWRCLQSACTAYVFQTYEWLYAWQKHLGEHQGWQAQLVELRDANGAIRMLFPLGICTQNHTRILSFLGGELTDYHAPLMHPDCLLVLNQSNFQHLWRSIVAILPPFDMVAFKRMPQDVESATNPMIWIDGMQPTEQAHAAILPSNFEAFQKTRSAKMFADTRRQFRRLSALGNLQLYVQVSTADQGAVIQAMAKQKSRRWQETGSRDLFALPGYLSFYRYLTQHGIAQGQVIVSGLQLNGEWIATHWGVRYGNRFYWIMPGYEQDVWARYSPGRVLLDAVVQWAIAQELHVFDLTVGDEAYKRQWADQTMSLYAGSYGITLKGKCIVLAQRIYYQTRSRLRNIVWLKRGVKRLRGVGSANN